MGTNASGDFPRRPSRRAEWGQYRHSERTKMVLANADFVARLKSGAAMNQADRATFFGGDARGYTDYPALEVAAPA